VLESDETATLAGRNLGLLSGDEAPAVVPLLDRLRARLGEDAVTRVMPHAEHRPERAWESRVRYDFSCIASGLAGTAGKVVSDPTFRPVWLLAEPEPIGHALESRPW